MTPERLGSLVARGVCLDTETHWIQAGLLAPPLVCMAASWVDAGGRLATHLCDKEEAPALFAEVVDDPTRPLVLANAPFDMAVMAVRLAALGIDAMPQIFEAYATGRVFDILIAEALHAIAEGTLNKDPRTGGAIINPETGKRGRYSLASTVDFVLGRKDAKVNDQYRERYHEFDGVPIALWPPQAVQYPQDDVRNTFEACLAQAGIIARPGGRHDWVVIPRFESVAGYISTCRYCGEHLTTGSKIGECKPRAMPSRNLHDLSNQVYTHWAMHLGAMHGFMVNQASVQLVEDDANRGREDATKPFVEAGLIRTDGSQDLAATKRRVAIAYGANQPCPVCNGTGKVPSRKNPKSKINCCAWDVDNLDDKGEPTKIKTCDGTGLLLETADVPRSEKEGVGYGRDVLTESGDETLIGLAEHQEDAKVLNVYVPFLRRARQPIASHAGECPLVASDKGKCSCPGPYRDIPLTLWPNVLVETGRTAYGGVIQQFPRAPGRWVEIDTVDGKVKVYVPSLRECIVARPGHWLGSCDYEAGELITWAQACIYLVGHSDLATALLKGVKPHDALGATTIGLGYEEFLRRREAKDRTCVDVRQAAKPTNFGVPGGMGDAKMALTQRKQGPDTPCPNGPHWIIDEATQKPVRGYKGLRFCILMDKAERCGDVKVTEWNGRPVPPICRHCIECCGRLKAAWHRQWSEGKPYFSYINECIDEGMLITAEMLARWPHLQPWFRPNERLAPGEIMQLVSGRVRGGADYCALANGFFQGLLADAAKSALRCASRECYDRTLRIPTMAHPNSRPSAYGGLESPMLGSRIIVFQHDEVIPEVPIAQAHDSMMRLSEIMVEELMWYCPDLAGACAAEPALMTRWLKGAVPWWRDGGKKRAGANDRLVPWEPKT